MKFAIPILIPFTLATCHVLSFDNSVSPQQIALLKKFTENAMQKHLVNPNRCSLFTALSLIQNDVEAMYLRRTGKECPKTKFVCSHCNMGFGDYTQAHFHDCI